MHFDELNDELNNVAATLSGEKEDYVTDIAKGMTAHPPLGSINPVIPDWLMCLPYQQQSVCLLALRGPDGFPKHHGCKDLLRAYRASVLKAAYYGRLLHMGEEADTFMDGSVVTNPVKWSAAISAYLHVIDELPKHYHSHFMHGAQILSYKHPHQTVRAAWREFYLLCCSDLHLNPETEDQMDRRLADWDREHWD